MSKISYHLQGVGAAIAHPQTLCSRQTHTTTVLLILILITNTTKMISRFSSTISSAMHCQPNKGLGRVLVLFAFEGMYLFVGGKLQRESIFGASAGWLNLDQLIQSGRCKCITAPT